MIADVILNIKTQKADFHLIFKRPSLKTVDFVVALIFIERNSLECRIH